LEKLTVLSLHEYQRNLAGGLLGSLSLQDAEALRSSGLNSSALRVHQQTIFHTLTKALRHTFPSVLKVLGDDCFAQAAASYSAQHPPRVAMLSSYGVSFPMYLRLLDTHVSTALLFDVARFDWLIDEIANEPCGLFCEPIALSREINLRLDLSLRCRRFDFPVDSIRDASLSELPDLLCSGGASAARNLAIWRKPEGAAVKPLSNCAKQFVESLRAGDGPEKAMAHSLGGLNASEMIRRVQAEVFATSFCQITVTGDKTP
jgi:Putative DNA-binding domain